MKEEYLSIDTITRLVELEKENKILKQNAINNDKVVDEVNWKNKKLQNKIDKINEYCNDIIERRIDITDSDYDLGQDSVALDIHRILEGDNNV